METKRLEQLLEQLKASGLSAPNLPLGVWRAIAGVVPLPAVEVIMSTDGSDFLLTYRRDDDWDGWHIPGGYMGCGESVAEACSRIAQREVGMDVALEHVIGAFAWPDHPYANTVSLICHCTPQGVPQVGKYFTELPSSVVFHHADFLRLFFEKCRR